MAQLLFIETSFLLLLTTVAMVTGNQPHIIFLLADDMGIHDIGYNNDEVITPTLDALAEDGVRLTHMYAQPTCGPSRHALLTGRYPFRDGMQHLNIVEYQPVCSPLDLTLLPGKLKQLGYSTHMVGKWHMGFCHEDCLPTRRGFDSFHGYYSSGETYYTHQSQYASGYDLRSDDEIDWDPDRTYGTFLQERHAVDAIRNHDTDEGPLFLYAAFQAPHLPLQVPDEFLNMYPDIQDEARKPYLAMISALDRSVANILAELEHKDMLKDSLVIFMSDNGGNSFCGDNAPYRGEKGSLYEGAVRVPALVTGGALNRSNVIEDGLFHIVDWYATLAAAAGSDDLDDGVFGARDSLNQWAMLQGRSESARESVILNIDINSDVRAPAGGYAAVSEGRFKLIMGTAGGAYGYTAGLALCNLTNSCEGLRQRWIDNNVIVYDIPQSPAAVQQRLWRTLQALDGGNVTSDQVRLYDLDADPGEETDVGSVYPEVRERLRAQLLSLVVEVAYPMVVDGDPSGHPSHHNGTISPGWCTRQSLDDLRLQSLQRVWTSGASSWKTINLMCRWILFDKGSLSIIIISSSSSSSSSTTTTTTAATAAVARSVNLLFAVVVL